MKTVLRFLLPLLVLAAAGWTARWMIVNREAPRTWNPPEPSLRVEATRLEPTDYQVVVDTRGTVRPRTEADLIPEVAGRIVKISPSLREGGFFEAGDVLLRLDATDYETAVVVARGALAQAHAALAEEEARAAQAQENWKRLGKEGEPSALVLRKPQLAQAQANVAASEAELAKAQRDLDRTELRAPFPGRTVEQLVDLGQYITPGTVVARGYAIDYVEVRLPLTNDELAFVELPEHYRGESEQDAEADGPAVRFEGRLGGLQGTWMGRIVRVEGAIDEVSRQLFVIAQIDDPYRKREDGTPPLKIGLFLDAHITGKVLEDVFVLPRRVMRPSGEILLIDEESRLRRRTVTPLWSSATEIVVPRGEAGLEPGDIVCLTPLATPVEGAPVLATIDGVAPAEPEAARPRPGGKGPGDGKREKGAGGAERSGDRPTAPKASEKSTSVDRDEASSKPAT